MLNESCRHCGSTVGVREYPYIRNFVCRHCEVDYYDCDVCGYTFYHTEGYFCSCGDTAYCSARCLRENPCPCDNPTDTLVHSYHGDSRPERVFHGSGPTFYGLELETDRYPLRHIAAEALYVLSDDETLFHLEEDGSLSSQGMELVFQPRTLHSWREFEMHLKRITECIELEGGQAFDVHACGAHVHRSNHDITDEIAAKLIIFFAQNRENIETLAQRKATPHCRFSGIFGNWDLPNTLRKVSYKEHQETRYSAINFQNAETVEFRVFKGTLNTKKLLAYIEFCDAVVEFVKTVSIDELLSNADTWIGFGEFVRTNKYQYLLAHMYKQVLI